MCGGVLACTCRHVTSYVERKMQENSWYDPRVVLRYKGEEEKGA